MYGLTLDWERCPDGVELFDYGLEPELPRNYHREGRSVLDSPKSGRWFRYRSERRVSVQHVLADLENPIVLQYVSATTPEAQAKFFSKFGLSIKWEWEEKGETALPEEEVRRIQLEFLKLLDAAGSGNSMVALNAVNGAMRSNRLFASLIPSLQIPIGHSKPQLMLEPQHLAGFMLMELAMVAANGAVKTVCDHCFMPFITGPLTGRRSHAVYCSDKCRVAAMRKRNASKTDAARA